MKIQTHQPPTQKLETSRLRSAPLLDHWQVNGEQLDTLSLCESTRPGPEGIPATYQFCTTRESALSGGVKGLLLGAGLGLAAGAVAYVVGAGLGVLLDGTLNVLEVAHGSAQGIGLAQTAGIFGGVGAAMGGLGGAAAASFQHQEIAGTLYQHDQGVVFQPQGREKAIDLATYARATRQDEVDSQQWWASIAELNSAYRAGYAGVAGIEDF